MRSRVGIGAAVGSIVLGVTAIVATVLDPIDGDYGASLAGYLIVLTPIGAALGIVVGVVQVFSAVARAAERQIGARRSVAERVLEEGAETGYRMPFTTQSGRSLGKGPWRVAYDRCRNSVTRFHAVVDGTPNGPAREWLERIGAELDEELREAFLLARYGSVLSPRLVDTSDPSVKRVVERLGYAEKSFASATRHAAEIALDLASDTDFERIKAHLEVLVKEAPHLRDLPAS